MEFIMYNDDTIKLLRECNSGTQMAVYSLNEVLENVQDSALKELLTASVKHHTDLGDRIHSKLIARGDDIKEPGALAKGMSWMKTNLKLTMEDSDRVCADLITDGCNMGIKSIQRYLNQYQAADPEAKETAAELMQIEEALCHSLRSYL